MNDKVWCVKINKCTQHRKLMALMVYIWEYDFAVTISIVKRKCHADRKRELVYNVNIYC